MCKTVLLFLLIPLSLFSKDMILTPADAPVIGELEPVLIRLLKDTKNLEASLADVYKDPELQKLVKKHNLQIFNGPMLGSVTDSSARFWVRTSEPAKVQVVIDNMKSNEVNTAKERDFTAVMEIKGLKAGTQYSYNVLFNGKPHMKKPAVFKTHPAPGSKVKFDVGFGGGARYISHREFIWDSIASYNPAAFLFLGDNLYIDLPKKRNMQNLYYYRRYLRPEFTNMSSTTAIYSIWDDHDFGVNDSAGGPEKFKPDWKFPVWKVYRNNWNNPYYGGGEKDPGCWFDFSIGDVDFFMTDNRYYRSFKDGTMLGPVQKKWLLEKLKNSKGKFKVIASGTLWTEHADKGGKDSWWGVKKEREEIFSFIEKNNIEGVVLISADRHRSEVFKIVRPNGYDFYEFESSKLTNDHTHKANKKSLITYNKGNFFGMLTFDLTLADPELTFRCITNDKKETQNYKIKLSQLKKSK